MVEEKLHNGGGDDDDPRTLLEIAVRDGRVDILRTMLQQLAKGPKFVELIDGQLKDFDGTLLHLAVKLDSVDSVRTLLSSGANPCVQNDDGKTAVVSATHENVKAAFVQELMQSVATSNLGRVCQLLAAGVNVNSIDSPQTQNTTLHYAASFASDEIVKTLCESGANVNAQNNQNDTPLHDAVVRKSESVIKILLEFGADSSITNTNGESAVDLAEKRAPELLSLFSLNNVAQVVHRTLSVDSIEFDRSSIISTDTVPLFTERNTLGKIESWTDLIWPQPHYIKVDSNDRIMKFPIDHRLKIYFDGCGDGEPRRMMQVVQTFVSYLTSLSLEIEYRGHKVSDSELDGRIMVGIFEDGERPGTYTLDIRPNGIHLMANDYSGIRHGFATLVQILRIFRISEHGKHKESSISSFNGYTNGNTLNSATSLTEVSSSDSSLSVIPCLSIRDYPDLTVRAVYQDFSGCKMLNVDTVLQLVNRLSYCKANYFFVNFEIRTTDRYQLPYTNRDLFHMTQVCEELFIKLVPSLDLQTNSVDIPTALKIINLFLDDFPLSRIAHFGPNISSLLVQNFAILDSIQKRIPRIFLSVEDVRLSDTVWINRLPSYVTLCVEGKFPFTSEDFISPSINLVLKFPTTDIGFLTASPETTAKNALLATQLCQKISTRGIMICDNSNGCEIMPPSMSLMPECACIGAAWNRSVDIKRFAFLLPRITAEHFLLDGNLVILLEQASNIGRVEHELTKYSGGKLSTNGSSSTTTLTSSSSFGISVFVEILLNPENIQLKRLTPSMFKKARIELQRSMRALKDARSAMRYEQYELALILAEISLVTELMTLVSKIGQHLCFYGSGKNFNTSNGSTTGADFINSEYLGNQGLGVSKLPQAIRTDLANSLLEIRRKFQHTWMCRNLAYTLPNALKMFDNLFRALLPPGMQEYEKVL
uniref:Beta-hexosaminidase bacterial type N-terminal domain-containing protein n=1 Tax=Panagrolaimus sp. PS1159 TaxID=55785 RepID=A0AC35FXL7_9BILA